ncbi:hypothetical protein PDJAM_G00018110 [Pangasius djambal]|uniref:Uncharacterized protein n=1 Tax=Pangasius djambal TaxID=1691987 RepID=A0ACC5YMN9_9TELE|nr:hypothetical protein [Pangasius djambal]
MTLMVCKRKRSNIEIGKKTKWWKLKKEDCCEDFRQKLRQALGGQVVLPDDWETTAEVIRVTGRKVLGVSSGRRKEDKETWWWNEGVQDKNRQEYKELQRRVKREVSNAKQEAYDKLYTRLDTREGQKDLYGLARQRDRDGKDVQQVRVIKDRDRRVLTSEESVQRRWKEYFEKLMNEENEREKRVEWLTSVEQKVDKIRKDEVRKALKRMESGKAVGPDDIPVEVWKCLGEAAVEFLTSVFNRVLESEKMPGHVPTSFKKARVIPILKKPSLDPSDISNYRPVSLLSFLSKTLECTVYNQLSLYLSQNNLQDPNQSDFKPEHSTETGLLAVTEKLHASRSAKLSSVLILLDLSAAFDTVNHKTLLSTLMSLGIRGAASFGQHQWSASYLEGWSYQVTWRRSTSAPRRLSTGVPQGSVLGPFLFSLYTRSLGAVISSHGFSYHCYADDTQLILSFPPSDTNVSAQISACLADISSWMTAHQLKLDPTKTELLFIPDLEKAYDRVPREELWYCMRKSGVAEKYVRVVQDMYERSRTVVRCAVGQTEEFEVEVGLHQGSVLSPFLFAMVMDQLSEEVRQESPCTMMFADDIVICSESREQVEENLERCRFALERRGMKVSRSKSEYMCVNEREGSGTVRLQGEEVKKVQEFKYLGSTVQSNCECGKEVKKRVQAGWNGWRKVSGVLCDRKISGRIKGKVYETVVRPAMLYGLETVSLRKRQESELEVAELKMLRFSLGVTRLDRIRNEYIRGTAHVGCLGDKVREARLRWFGHVQRRESEYIVRRMLDMELPGRRQRGRPKRRYMEVINEYIKLVGASVEDAEDRDRWRVMIRCGNP